MAWNMESLWTFAFNYDVIWLSVIFMYAILGFVIVAFVRVQRLANEDFLNGGRVGFRYLHLWSAVIPTAVNFGWIVVASSVNALTAVTRYAGTPGVAYTFPAFTTQLGAVVLGLITVVLSSLAIRMMSASLAFTFVWAFMGVASFHTGIDHTVALIGVACFAVVGTVVLALPFAAPELAKKAAGTNFGPAKNDNKEGVYQTMDNGSPITNL